MARVRHPNVVPIYGVDQHEGRVGFWSDFVQGQTLSDLLATQGPLGPREAALVGIDVCRAVGAVHAAGFIHRDIKAGNVMREEGGRILLMDFGLTHESGTDDYPSGTPAYMAPELLIGQPATIASDVYAIGVLLFNLLTARYPVEGADLGKLRAAHALRRPPDLARRAARSAGGAGPRGRDGDQPRSPEAFRQRRAAGGRAVRSDRHGLGNDGRTAAREAARPSRAWMLAPVAAAAVALLLVFPQVRAVFAPGPVTQTPAAGMQEDYRRARDLLAHYYRPQALETAIPLLEKIVAHDPQFAPAFADLARANFLQFTQQRETKYIEPAREAALRALALAPDLASAHVTLGALYAWTAQNDLASHELEEALRLDRFNAAAYGALAELYKRQGRTELVEPTLQKAVSLAPDDWSLMQQLGEYYLDNGKWAQAGEQYRRAVELMPDNPRPHNNLGLVYQGLGRLEESAAAFQRAIDLEPTLHSLQEPGHGAGRGRKVRGGLPDAGAVDRDATRQLSGLGAPRVRLSQPARRPGEGQGDLSSRPSLSPRTSGRKRRGTSTCWPTSAATTRPSGWKKESLPLLAQAAALAPDVPQVLYQVAIGYEDASPPRGGAALACQGEGEWLSFRIHRAEPPVGRPSRRPTVRRDRWRSSLAAAHTEGGDSMPNPNVDRSAPPRPAKKKTAKKKVTKKPAKKR